MRYLIDYQLDFAQYKRGQTVSVKRKRWGKEQETWTKQGIIIYKNDYFFVFQTDKGLRYTTSLSDIIENVCEVKKIEPVDRLFKKLS